MKNTYSAISLLLLAALPLLGAARSSADKREAPPPPLSLFTADNRNFQYTGRIDFSNPRLPKFWSPGVYLRARFRGPSCDLVVNDQVLWGTSHNYIEIAVDDRKPFRIQTTGPANTIRIADGLSNGPHSITICKDTEAGIGYLEFVGLRCAGLLPPTRRPKRKLEFIGDSITCGAGSDTSEKPCGQGQWYDQHNAYFAYGPSTARTLKAEWHLTSVSGIGLVHSCCDMKTTMPQVFDWMNLNDAAAGTWDVKRYQPDAVTVCLGQNDGQLDPKTFDDAYVAFLRQLRAAYPKAQIVCLTSPMADPGLNAYLKQQLTQIVQRVHADGDNRVHSYFFAHHYNHGCGGHPDLEEHQQIANELSTYLASLMHW